MGLPGMDPLLRLNLPPGFRFYPTDEELMVQYLCRKVVGHRFPIPVIGEIDLYKFDPWVLPGKALFGDKEWYFFTPRDRKYPNGSRPNRVAGAGYWKATGTDKVIKTEGRTVGIKKALVFYIGKAPKGTKTNWIMHEYRLSQATNTTRPGDKKLDDWVLCRIYKKNSGGEKPTTESALSEEQSIGGSSSVSSTRFDDVLDSIPEMDGGFFDFSGMNQRLGVQNFGSGGMDWNALVGLTNGLQVGPIGMGKAQVQGQVMGGHVISGGSGTCADSVLPMRHVGSPEEVQSGVNPLGGLVGQGYLDPFDPFGIRYSAPVAGFGFGV